MLYAVIDVETTGGRAATDRIIEVGVVLHDGQRVLDTFQSLVNPDRPVPQGITSLTGISSSMVEDAPLFGDIAPRIAEMLEGAVMVAHNAAFDHAFIREELQRAGIRWNGARLCTVKLSRSVFRGFRSYSLASLCRELRITNTDPHRALSDAMAAADVLQACLEKAGEEPVKKLLNRREASILLPPNLSREDFDRLPTAPGVYYLLDEQAKPLYIGKSVNIKKRVAQHFLRQPRENSLLPGRIHHISFELAGNDLAASLLELHEIRQHWPEFNRASKYPLRTYGIFAYRDQNGNVRLSAGRVTGGVKPVRVFSSMLHTRTALQEAAAGYELCRRLCGLQAVACECRLCAGELRHSEHNEMMNRWIESVSESLPPVLISGPGRKPGESAHIYFDHFSEIRLIFHEDDEAFDIRNAVSSGKALNASVEMRAIINSYLNEENYSNYKVHYIKEEEYEQ